MGSLIPNAKVQFSDASGRPLVGGLVYMYTPNTENFKDTFQDRALSIPNTNPIVLDAFGEAVIWGTGVYRQVLTDSNGVQIWDQLTQDSNAGLIGNMTDAVYVPGDGTGNTFIPGTTTVLTLPSAPGSITNMWLFFDGTFQTDDQIASLNQTTLTLASPIPQFVNEVTIKIGTTVAIGVPGTGVIVDSMVAPGAAINASKLSFIQAGANAVRRSVLSKERDIVSVLDYGATGDGIHDDTTAMQAAHNTGKLIYYPAGTYKFSTLTIAAGGITGDGQGLSVLNSTDITAVDLITYTGSGIPLFEKFGVTASLTKTSGSALRFNTTTGQLSFPYIDGVGITNVAGGIRFTTVGQFHINCCDIVNYGASKGIWIENTIDADNGDSIIQGCFLNTSVPTGTTYGIWYRSSGGLKVLGTKILGGDSCFVQGFNSPTKNVADLQIVGCSFENSLSYGIFLGRDSGTNLFGSVIISATEIGCANGIQTDSSGYLTLLVIDGHIINLFSASGTAILLANVANFAIGSGIINGQVGGGNPIGISTVASNSNGKIAAQVFTGIPAANRIVNGSSTVAYQEVSLSGAVPNITTSATYGSVLFVGTMAVVFPQPFSVAPSSVNINGQPAGGGLPGGNAINITTTGFTAQCFGVTSGGVLSGYTYSTVGGVL